MMAARSIESTRLFCRDYERAQSANELSTRACPPAYLGHFLCDYALGKPFQDGGLTDTRRTDELRASSAQMQTRKVSRILTTGFDFVLRDRTAGL